MSNKADQFETKYSDNYEPSTLEKFVKKYETFRADVISDLASGSHGTLLDLACGDGEYLWKNKQFYSRLIGIDIASNRVKNALKKFKNVKNAKFIVHDLDVRLPLPDNSVDTAVCEASIGCLVRPDYFLTEVNRVLKKNGVFIVQIGNYAYFPRRIALLLGKLPKISSFSGFGDGGMLHYFTYNSLKELLITSNFTIEEVSNSGLLAKLRKIWPSLLAPDIIYKAVKNDKS